MPSHRSSAEVPPDLHAAVRAIRALAPAHIALQPIFRVRDAAVFGYEALLRPPPPWKGPLEFIEAAHKAGIGVLLEQACCDAAILAFVHHRLEGKLFINLGAAAVQASGIRNNRVVQTALENGLSPGRVVIELTEREPIHDMDSVVDTMKALRHCGLGLALDDYGQGYSGMKIWLELRPDILKVDQYFVGGLQTSSAKFEALRSLVRMAESLDTKLIAEGVETREELTILRDLGFPLVQGYFLGRPALEPARGVSAEVHEILCSRRISVFPEKIQVHAPHQGVGKLLLPVPGVERTTTVGEIARALEDDPALQAIAVVDGERPIGLISRQNFFDRLSRPFHREVYIKRECTLFMNAEPLIVEAETPVEGLLPILANDDQRYLTEGFIIAFDGRYLGLGRGVDLVRAVSALRIEAARHANPLTFLPGNIPISKHVERLLANGARFVAAYVDLDNFKPYNDQYGYWRGDEMIKLAAQTMLDNVEVGVDFVGHIGGDDFVVLFQSTQWFARCEAIIQQFGASAAMFYDDQDLNRRGLEAEDRYGEAAFFPLATISIGVVEVEPQAYRYAREVAAAATAAKRQAKRNGGNCLVKYAPGTSFRSDAMTVMPTRRAPSDVAADRAGSDGLLLR